MGFWYAFRAEMCDSVKSYHTNTLFKFRFWNDYETGAHNNKKLKNI